MITESMILAGAKAYDEGAFAEPLCKCAGCAESRELSQSAALDWSRKILTAALSDQAGEWQDISTAPKIEGVYVDLWMPKLSGEYGRIPDCKWLGNESQPGWYAECDEGAYYVGERATHWMYRPAAPPPSSTAGEG